MTAINIRPGVNVLSVLRHLNYKPWFALAEFVDNSLQSYLRHRSGLESASESKLILKVDINIDAVDRRIVIRDNAGGIAASEFPRAFRAAELPPDRKGLSEFGMGMKSASCWFAPRWSARTTPLNDPVERTVRFDITTIVRDELEELEVEERACDPLAHYTEIVLWDVYKIPAGRTVGKIKAHLTDIYRIFIRQNVLELRVNGEVLEYSPPEILEAPHYKRPEETPAQWIKDFTVELPEDRRIYGFGALRKTGSTSDAGFALFRRNRLIQGSADEGYRPEAIFGRSNSFVYQRLFGEIHLQGFGVSHTKDGIQWDGMEEVVLERLREALDSEPLPLLRQAREYRLAPRRDELKRAADTAINRAADAIEREIPRAAADIDERIALSPPEPRFSANQAPFSSRQIETEYGGVRWSILLEATNDAAVGDWLEIFDRSSSEEGHQHLGVRLALAHPFTQRFSTGDPQEIEMLLRIAAGLALAEAIARSSGSKQLGAIRHLLNRLLRDALSK